MKKFLLVDVSVAEDSLYFSIADVSIAEDSLFFSIPAFA